MRDRSATAPEGRCDDLVSFIAPSRDTYDLLVAEGVDRIVEATNTPMADTFARAGYPVDQHRIDLVP